MLTFDQALQMMATSIAVIGALAAALQWWMVANIRRGNDVLLRKIEEQFATTNRRIEEETRAIREDLADHEARLRVLEDRSMNHTSSST